MAFLAGFWKPPQFWELTEKVDEAKSFPWCFFEIFFATAYMNYDGTWDWNSFKETVKIVKKIKDLKTRDASNKPEGYMET